MQVELLGHFGSDEAVVRAARVSYGKEKKDPVSDAFLIDYLIRHGHTSPFAHTAFTFRLKIPIYVARQIMRHHVGIAWNELSMRYVRPNDDYFTPYRIQDDARNTYEGAIEKAFESYMLLIKQGVPREIARGVLPLATYTTIIMTANLRALFNLWEQRLAPEAQEETRMVAEAMLEKVRGLTEFRVSLMCWEFWRRRIRFWAHYEMHAMSLAQGDKEAVDRYIRKLHEERLLDI